MHKEIVAGNSRFRVGAGGFIAYGAIGGTPVLDGSDNPALRGVWVDAFIPGNPAERFPVRGEIVPVVPAISAGSAQDARLRIEARAGVQDLSAAACIQAHPGRDGQLNVEAHIALDGRGWIAAMGLALPLVIDPDPLCRRTTVGGEQREETWRLDQNDEDTSEAWLRKVSDTRARWPPWRIGGLLVDAPHHYTIWKASDMTTPALSMDQGRQCPGWMTYTTQTAALRLHWPDIHGHAPAGLTLDGEAGVLWIWLHPPAVRPLRVAGQTTRSAAFTLTLEQRGTV